MGNINSSLSPLIDPAPGYTNRRYDPHATTTAHPLPRVLTHIRRAAGIRALEAAVQTGLFKLGPHPAERFEEEMSAGRGFWGGERCVFGGVGDQVAGCG